eukprot:Gb_25582 [translate_table: standard]
MHSYEVCNVIVTLGLKNDGMCVMNKVKDFAFISVNKALAAPQHSIKLAGFGVSNHNFIDLGHHALLPSISTIPVTARQGRTKEDGNGDAEGIPTASKTFASLLQDCITKKDISTGKRVHAHLIKTGFTRGIFLWNRLIDFYGKCGMVSNARQVFEKMSARNVFSWNVMITGYVKVGSIDDARELFDKMPERDGVSWNSMVAGYAQHGFGEEALRLFCQMQVSRVKLDQFTFVVILSACTNLTALEQGKQVHAHIIKIGFESNTFVGNAFIDMYAKCGTIEDARQMFDNMPDCNEVSKNAMIGGYVIHGLEEAALKFYSEMHREGNIPTESTFASILSACTGLSALEQGKQVHAHVIRNGFESKAFVGNALVDLYAKLGCTNDAQQVFEKMFERNVVSWNGMIAGYARHGQSEEALKHFWQMGQAGVKPNRFTFPRVLGVCASLAALEQGKQVHACIIRTGFESNTFAGSGLVDMYAKCGNIEDAHQVFDEMPERDAVSWTAMIVGCAQNGHGMESLQLFETMVRGGMIPDDIAFIGVLSACSHAGLVDEGLRYFNLMSQDYGISPGTDHYACMVDLLGRAGLLNEAKDFMNNMPFKPNSSMWGALLGACRNHGNIDLGKHAAECLLELEPQMAAPYVVLSNIYAAAGRWGEAAYIRKMLKDTGVKKKAGCSWIQVKNRVHLFVVEDRSHPQTEEIYETLEKLAREMKVAGYVPNMNLGLHDVE